MRVADYGKRVKIWMPGGFIFDPDLVADISLDEFSEWLKNKRMAALVHRNTYDFVCFEHGKKIADIESRAIIDSYFS